MADEETVDGSSSTIEEYLGGLRIRVVSEHGEQKVISLTPPVEINLKGEKCSYIACSDGREYYFTKAGLYDGSGQVVNKKPKMEENPRFMVCAHEWSKAEDFLNSCPRYRLVYTQMNRHEVGEGLFEDWLTFVLELKT